MAMRSSFVTCGGTCAPIIRMVPPPAAKSTKAALPEARPLSDQKPRDEVGQLALQPVIHGLRPNNTAMSCDNSRNSGRRISAIIALHRSEAPTVFTLETASAMYNLCSPKE